MNKTDFIAKVSEKSEMDKKTTTMVVNAAIDVITESLASKDSIQITGFGTFKTVHKDERTARNPKTGENVVVAAKDVPKFSFADSIKNAVK